MNTHKKPFDLVAFDVDGTLVAHPRGKTVWDVLNHRYTGREDLNEERSHLYRTKRLSYEEWVALDIESWRRAGATRRDLIAGFESLTLVPGTREALGILKEQGIRLAVISGTLDLLLDTLFPDHPFDEVHTNKICFDESGYISGHRATPFDMDGKAVALRSIARHQRIPLSRCAFVGDNDNDIPAARVAGFAIAFNPKSPDFEAAVHVVVRSCDLRDILPHLLP